MRNKKIEGLPKISIIIPSYNKVTYIESTLLSIINQRYPNLEVIIQDGGSKDGTLEIIKRYANKFPKIFQWITKRDKGQLDAINKGFMKATGEILTYINADDIYKNGCLFAVGRHFKEYPNPLWVTGYGDIIDEEGNVISGLVTNYKNFLLNINNYSLLLVVNFITQSSTFISRKVYLQFGPFTGTKDYVMEYDLWLRIGKFRMPYLIKKNLSSFRLTTDNISTIASRELLKIDNQIVKKYTKNPLFLALHKFHNLGRIFLLNFI